MNKYFYLSLIISFLGFQSCSESLVEVTDYQDVIIDDNQIDTVKTFSRIDVENYVNRAFIDLWGELSPNTNQYVDALIADSLSLNARKDFIATVLDGERFFTFQKEQDYASYLNGIANYEVEEQMNLYYAIALDAYEREDYFLYFYYIEEFEKLERLNESNRLRRQDSITNSEYLTIIAFNVIYDEINMGSENFVKAIFENFVGRLPTEYELEQGINMVDNSSGIVFNQDGNTKMDLLTIVTQSSECEEQIIRSVYNQLISKPIPVPLLTELIEEVDIETDIKSIFLTIATTDTYVFNE